MTRISRRSFIKTSAYASVGISALSLTTGLVSAGDDKPSVSGCPPETGWPKTGTAHFKETRTWANYKKLSTPASAGWVSPYYHQSGDVYCKYILTEVGVTRWDTIKNEDYDPDFAPDGHTANGLAPDGAVQANNEWELDSPNGANNQGTLTRTYDKSWTRNAKYKKDGECLTGTKPADGPSRFAP